MTGIVSVIISILLISCSNVKPGKTRVTINLKGHEVQENKISMVDRFLRLFATEARAAAPQGIVSLTLLVTASDMDPIVRECPVDAAEILLEVPAGNERIFVLAAVASSTNYIGTATADLTTGKDENLTITMIALPSSYTALSVTPAFPLGTPSGLGAYTLNVSASGTVIYSIPGYPSGSAVPLIPGSSYTIEVLAAITSGTLRYATTTQVLATGDIVALNAPMSLYRTKVLIPDTWNNRVAQIDEFPTTVSSTGWTVFDYNYMLPLDNTWIDFDFLPNDVDYDSLGRIYIANNSNNTDRDVIIRADSISGGNVIAFGANGSGFGYEAIAIDRVNNVIYKAKYNVLSKCNLDGSNDTALATTTGITSIYGLAVDSSGLLYITYGASTPQFIGIYDPATDSIPTSTMITGNPKGILIKPPYVYVTNPNGGNGYQIKRFTTDLSTSTSNGDSTTSATSTPGLFYGPGNFLAKDNDKIIVTDYWGCGSQILSFDDLNWNGWNIYGTTGTLQDQFYFYSGCK